MSGIAARWAAGELAALKGQGLLRALEPLAHRSGVEVRVGDERLTDFCSNDYLGLASSPVLARAAGAALEDGVGAGASRLVVGDLRAHHALEEAVRRHHRAASARLFNSGYAANVGVLGALLGEGDVVFSDALNHASLIDGCRLSRARTVVYPHADVGALEALLAAHPGRRRLVCTDAVFSMDGDLAPLGELSEICRAHGAALLVDEAHAVGVLGPSGGGLCEALGVEDSVDVRVGTLGKAFGAFGAYVLAAPELSSLWVNRARSFVFSTALPPMVCAAAQAGVLEASAHPELRERLWKNVAQFAAGLSALGLEASPRAPIFPVLVGSPERAVELSALLRREGIWVKAIRPPTVPEGTSRLRFSLSAAHTPAQLSRALEALGAHRALWARP